MRRPPPLSRALEFPATGAVVIAAVVGTLLAWSRPAVLDALVMDPRAIGPEPWRIFSSALLHGDLLHIAFNLGWVWSLGTFLEARFGAAKTLATMALLAAGASLYEYALFDGGIGLSGVVYGLAALLYVLGRRDPRYAGAVDRQTVQLLAAWFVACVVLTVAHVWRIGNAAHAAGAVFGALLGGAIGAKGARRAGYAAVIAAALGAGVVGASVARPWVDLAHDAGSDVERLGYTALERGDTTDAVRWFERSTRYRHPPARRFFNLGIAYDRVHRADDAAAAFARAHAIDPANPRYRDAAAAAIARAQSLHPASGP